MGEVRRDDGKRNIFGARRGVGPPRHPSTMRGGASRLPKVPDRRRFGLEEGAIRRMQARAFSSEVNTDSRQEKAMKQRSRAAF